MPQGGWTWRSPTNYRFEDMKCMPKWGPKTHGVIEVIEGLKAPKNINLIIGKKQVFTRRMLAAAPIRKVIL